MAQIDIVLDKHWANLRGLGNVLNLNIAEEITGGLQTGPCAAGTGANGGGNGSYTNITDGYPGTDNTGGGGGGTSGSSATGCKGGKGGSGIIIIIYTAAAASFPSSNIWRVRQLVMG